MLICLSGFTPETKEILSSKAKSLGFQVEAALTSNVQVCICESITEKYKVAVKRGIKVTGKDWLYNHHKDTTEFALKPLSGFNISLTGFEQRERERLAGIIVRHGGHHSPDLSKACTHLITNGIVESNKKIEYAVKWKLSILSADWLIKIDRALNWVDESPYSTHPSGCSFSQSSQETRFATQTQDSRIVTTQSNSESRTIQVRSSRVTNSFLSASMAAFGQIGPKVEKTNGIFSGMVFCAVGFKSAQLSVLEKEIVDGGGVFKGAYAWESCRDPKQTLHVVVRFEDRKSRHQPVIGEVVVTENWIERCLEESRLIDLDESIITPIPSFEKLNFGISGYDSLERIHLVRLVGVLGASIGEKFSKRNTHLICKPDCSGAFPDTQKYIKAKEWGIPVLAGDCIRECAKTGKAGFLGQIEFDTSVLDLDEGCKSPLVESFSRVLQAAVEDSNKPSKHADFKASAVKNSPGQMESTHQKPLQKSPVDPKMSFENLISTQLVDELIQKQESVQERTVARSSNSCGQPYTPPSIFAPSVNEEAVTYDDPEEVSAKRKLVESAQLNCKRPCKSNDAKRFMISGVVSADRTALIKGIQSLGGIYLDSDSWDPSCTHLICGKPSKTEKCLAACASGLWILSQSYISESLLENRFLAEARFEWSAALDASALTVGRDRELIESGSRWRIRLGNYLSRGVKRGSFEKWDVLLAVEAKKVDGFLRVLEAGLAAVSTTPSNNGKLFTHCFVDYPTATSDIWKAEIERLRKLNVPMLDPCFIADFLNKAQPISSSDPTYCMKQPRARKKKV